jgi:hypothetical protein
MHIILNIWFDGGWFVNFYFDIWVIVLHSICMTNVMLSFQKFIMNPFLKVQFSLKSIATWIIKIFNNVNVEYGFTFVIHL